MSDWHRLASTADVREGEALSADLDGIAIALYRVSGLIYALDDTCTHEFALLSQGFVEDGVV